MALANDFFAPRASERGSTQIGRLKSEIGRLKSQIANWTGFKITLPLPVAASSLGPRRCHLSSVYSIFPVEIRLSEVDKKQLYERLKHSRVHTGSVHGGSS